VRITRKEYGYRSHHVLYITLANYISAMKENLRQIVHLGVGLGIAAMIYSIDREVSLAILAISIFIGLLVTDAVLRGYYVPFFSPIIARLERKDAVPGKGALFFVITALFCLVIFDAGIVVLAMVVLSLLDSISTIYGIRYGRTRFYNGKSLEGSAVGSMAALVALAFALPLATALIVAVIAGAVELLSPVDDNLTVPVSVCIVLSVLL
jgi:phytol kinase